MATSITNLILDNTQIDVLSKHRLLVQEALSDESIYVRTREVMSELINDGSLSSGEKAKIIANALASMTSSMTASAMDSALRWATAEQDMIIKNVETSAKINAVLAEISKSEKELEILNVDKKIKQAQSIRLYGTPTLDNKGNVLSLSDDGKEFEAIKLIKEEQLNAQKSRAKVDDDLITAGKNRTMIEKQTDLYVRQTLGFDDNKYQKLFDSQIQSWALMYSSGMLETIPTIITNDKASELYTKLTSGLV